VPNEVVCEVTCTCEVRFLASRATETLRVASMNEGAEVHLQVVVVLEPLLARYTIMLEVTFFFHVSICCFLSLELSIALFTG
jgi:hypothetical protein